MTESGNNIQFSQALIQQRSGTPLTRRNKTENSKSDQKFTYNKVKEDIEAKHNDVSHDLYINLYLKT